MNLTTIFNKITSFIRSFFINDLQEAIQIGDLNKVIELLDNGESIEVPNFANNAPLLVATIYGHENIVRFLLSRGANLEAKDFYGFTALHAATAKGLVRIAKILLENGADIEAQNNDGGTPLHVAAEYNGTAIDLLLFYGANVTATNYKREIPYLIARKKGFTSLSAYLKDTEATQGEICNVPLTDAEVRSLINLEQKVKSIKLGANGEIIRNSELTEKWANLNPNVKLEVASFCNQNALSTLGKGLLCSFDKGNPEICLAGLQTSEYVLCEVI
jgi:hypothetical protein